VPQQRAFSKAGVESDRWNVFVWGVPGLKATLARTSSKETEEMRPQHGARRAEREQVRCDA
jgi:hypothetical protein